MSQNAQAYLNQLLADDGLQEVLELLRNPALPLPKDLEAEIVIISGKYAAIERQERLGTADTEEISLGRNRIREALVAIVKELPADLVLSPVHLKKRKIRRYTSFALVGAFVLIALALLVYALQPKQDIRIEAQLLLEQVSFRHLEGAYAFAGRALSALHLYNYARLEVDGLSLKRDLVMPGDGDRQVQELTAPLVVEPFPEVAGIGVNLGQIRMEKLSIPAGALLSLNRPAHAQEPLQIRIQHEAPLFGYMSYADSLDITAEQSSVRAEAQQWELLDAALMRLYAAQGMAGQIKFESFPGTISLDMYLKDSLPLNALGLRVAEVSFYKPLEQLAVPSILSGEIRIQEVNASPLEVISLQAGEALNLIGATSLSLDQLTIGTEGIRLSFTGRVQAIESGRNEESRNPSRLRWMWHNQRLILVGIALLFLGILWVLGRNKSRYLS